jgi:hypothetical protein
MQKILIKFIKFFRKKWPFLTAFLLILGLPSILFASTIITEIMYDPEGADTGREWVEIKNIGDQDVDVTTLKLLENNVNHKITFFSGSGSILKSGEYAVIADNPEKFLIDWNQKFNRAFTGLLFDSAFSLNNTGEPLAIIGADGQILNSFSYTSDLGAKGNGLSLQFTGEMWIEAEITPGFTNNTTPPDNSGQGSGQSSSGGSTGNSSGNGSTNTSSNQSTHSGQSEIVKLADKPTLQVGSGRDRLVSINTPLNFQALHNQKESKPKFYWATGDGGKHNGEKISHTYYQSGIYNLVLTGFSGKEQVSSRLKVTVFEPNVDIVLISMGKAVNILLKNNSQYELNLGGFQIHYGKRRFIIPVDTIVDSGKEVQFDYRITGLYIPDDLEELLNNPPKVLYPNQEVLFKLF